MNNADIAGELMLISQKYKKRMKEAEARCSRKQSEKEDVEQIAERCMFTGKAAAYREMINSIDSLRGRI